MMWDIKHMLVYLRKHKPFFRALLFFSVAFLCGGLIGSWLANTYAYPPCQTNLKFINPSIACGKKQVLDKAEYVSLRNDLISYIDTQKKQGEATSVAIFFRDLSNGPTLGINENEVFSPASLLKLPLAFTFFNLEEKGDAVFDRLIQYTSMPAVETQTFIPGVSAKPNQSYSIETLIANMLAYSDNISYQMLVEYLNEQPGGFDQINQTFQDLGIIDPQSEGQNTVTVRGYASLFRLLYNSSYLNNADSEKILSWLSKSDFNIGLVAGVPEGTVVAHKFGEREIGGLAPVDQLHDCGVIYYPGNPYSLCIMTRSTDIQKLPSIISTISGMVYKEVDSRKL